MYPILFRIGSRTVSSYTVGLIAGMIVGTWTAYRLARERLTDPAIVLDVGFWALLGGILGGRSGYVLANWAYYADHLDKAVSLREGGLSWYGALIGGCSAIVLWLPVRGLLNPPVPDWRDLFDVIGPGLALGCAFGWLGCLLAGCAYGFEANGYSAPLSWLAAVLPDIYGVDRIRFATQPLMIAWCTLVFGVLYALRHWLPRGLAVPLFLLLYTVAEFAVAFLRGDGTWRWGLWLSQWVALVGMCIAAGMGVYLCTRPDRYSHALVRPVRGPPS